MGYGLIEMRCPNNHVWVTDWCSVGTYRGPQTSCPECKEQGTNTGRSTQEILADSTRTGA